MKKYKPDEIILLADKITNCFYAWNQYLYLMPPQAAFRSEGSHREVEFIRMQFYREKFMQDLSELYTTFHLHQDNELRKKFKFSEPQILKLRDIRHNITHGAKNLGDVIKTQEEFAAMSNGEDLIRDFVEMIKHIRVLLKMINLDHELIRRLKEILTLYPSNFIHESIRKEILE